MKKTSTDVSSFFRYETFGLYLEYVMRSLIVTSKLKNCVFVEAGETDGIFAGIISA